MPVPYGTLGGMLGSMRDRSGGPNLAIKLLAILVALLLAGPLTILVIRAAAKVLDLAL